MAKKTHKTANPLAAKMERPKPATPIADEVKKTAKAVGKEISKRVSQKAPKAKKAAAPTGPVNVITDRSGQIFDPAIHAVHADGVTPHSDSFGHFIRKADHYDGAKKAHYGDTFRHA